MKTCTVGRLAFSKENNRGLEKIPRLDEPAEYSRLSLLVNYFSLFFISFTFCKIILAFSSPEFVDSVAFNLNQRCEVEIKNP